MDAKLDAFLASLQAQPGYSESTRLAYASDLRVFLNFLRERLQRSPELEDFKPQQVTRFLTRESLAGLRQSTILRRRASLRRFAHYLEESSLIAHSGEMDSEWAGGAVEATTATQPPPCLSEAQIASLWEAMESSPRPRARRDQAILMTLLETGLTVSALAQLDFPDLNLRKKQVKVLLEDVGERWLPLGKASEALECYIEEGRPEIVHRPDEEALFISQMNGRLSRQGIWQILHNWGRSISPPISLSPRLMRNTAALRMSRSGRSIAEIKAQLGHKNPISTQALIKRLEIACREANPS